MLTKLSFFVILIILIVCQSAPLSNRYFDDEDDENNSHKINKQLKLLSPERIAELDEYLSNRLKDDNSDNETDENYMTKRDALWTTTEVLDCVRRLKLYSGRSKLDLVTEMLNCYRRLKHSG